VIRPGQLNLMTAGHGVSHSEETAAVHSGELQGVQLWVAQPSSTRDSAPAFEHHADLPRGEVGDATATVLVGEFAGVTSPARRDTDHVGIDLELPAGRTIVPLDTTFEYGLVVTEGAARVGGAELAPGRFGYLGVGRDEVAVEASPSCRALLLGGLPFPEPLLMWWNYVARTRDEVAVAHSNWLDAHERFGHVASPLPRVVIAAPPWATAG